MANLWPMAAALINLPRTGMRRLKGKPPTTARPRILPAQDMAVNPFSAPHDTTARGAHPSSSPAAPPPPPHWSAPAAPAILTGFEPSDKNTPAPNWLPNAAEAFKEPTRGASNKVDPMGALTKDELEEHSRELKSIIQAQRHAEMLLGVSLRP
jgi:hypothetical protein